MDIGDPGFILSALVVAYQWAIASKCTEAQHYDKEKVHIGASYCSGPCLVSRDHR